MGHTNSSQFRGARDTCTRGGGGFPPPPPRPHPSGGDGCRGWSSYRKRPPSMRPPSAIAGTGSTPVPLRADQPAGATDAGGRPQTHPPASGRATNRKLSPFFTLTRTLRLPSVRALLSTSRTSAGVDTDLPPISRITSPVENP